MRRSLSLLCFLLACGVLIGNRTTNAQSPVESNEYEIKAGYFAYFGQLVKWPSPPFAGAGNEFVIGVLGGNPFGQHLRSLGNGFAINAGRIQAQTIQGKKIKVVEYRSVSDFQKNYSPCHILFISRSTAAGVAGETIQHRVDAALKKTNGQPVLLVSEVTNMDAARRIALSGVVICYWNDNQANQVKMIINRAAEQRKRVSISSRLLGLRIVTVL